MELVIVDSISQRTTKNFIKPLHQVSTTAKRDKTNRKFAFYDEENSKFNHSSGICFVAKAQMGKIIDCRKFGLDEMGITQSSTS